MKVTRKQFLQAAAAAVGGFFLAGGEREGWAYPVAKAAQPDNEGSVGFAAQIENRKDRVISVEEFTRRHPDIDLTGLAVEPYGVTINERAAMEMVRRMNKSTEEYKIKASLTIDRQLDDGFPAPSLKVIDPEHLVWVDVRVGTQTPPVPGENNNHDNALRLTGDQTQVYLEACTVSINNRSDYIVERLGELSLDPQKRVFNFEYNR